MRLLVVVSWISAVLLCSAGPAWAADPSGGAAAPAEATVETDTGGSLGPAAKPAPSRAPASEPRAAPDTAAPPATTAPATSGPAPAASVAVVGVPKARLAGNTVEPPAGGGEDSAPLEPVPPSSGQATAKPKQDGSGPALAMTGGEMATMLTLGVLLLATGLAGAALARRRRATY